MNKLTRLRWRLAQRCCALQPAGLKSLALPDSFPKGFVLARHQAPQAFVATQGISTTPWAGSSPVEVWNRLGTRLIPKLRALKGLQVRAEFAGELDPATQAALVGDLKTTIEELGLSGTLRVDQTHLSDPTKP